MAFLGWFFLALTALIFWGITGVTQKLSTNYISTRLSFLWFGVAFFPIALVILVSVPLDWNLTPGLFGLAVLGGVLNGLGVITSFAALRSGGKASIVIPMVYLYPLVTIVLAIVFLHEKLTRVQVTGIALAIVAAVLLCCEPAPREKELP
jgi:transporter family protein